MIVRRAATASAVVLAFVAVAVLATWPLASSAGHAIAGGLGDPLLNATVLAWDADRARHGFGGFWNIPFLFPHHHTLAYTEPLIGVALFVAPIEWLSGNPIAAYNAAYIGSYVLAGVGMFVLARHLWGRTDAAALAGLAFALTPYRIAQTTHLQVLMNGWMPLALWALHRYFETGLRRWIAGFAAGYIVLGLSNAYYLYFFLVPLASLLAIEMARPRVPRARIAGDLALAGAAVAAAIAPIAFVFYRLQREMGFERSASELGGLSAQLSDYFRVSTGAWTWGGVLAQGGGERQLFHGFVILIAAAVGACTLFAIPERGMGGNGRTRWTRSVAAYLLMTILAVWLSMGPGPWRPYGLLFDFVPGLNGLRVPARLASVVVLGLAALGGAGLAWILGRLTRRAAAVAALAIGALIVLEGQHGIGGAALTDLRALTGNTWDRVAYEWLRTSAPGGTLELNITQTDDFQPFTPIYQLRAVQHGHPIVNGYAGWKSQLQELLGGPASPLRDDDRIADVVRGLRAIGVRYVLVHDETFARPADLDRIVTGIRRASDQIAEERHWPGVTAWRLAEPAREASIGIGRAIDPRELTLHASAQEERIALVADGDIETRWLTGEPQTGDEWIDVQLARAADVARVRLESARRSLIDYPRRLAIDAIDRSGTTRTLFDGSIVDRLIEGLAVDERRAPVTIDLPPNRTVRLRIRQTGQSDRWWSLHELEVWEAAQAR